MSHAPAGPRPIVVDASVGLKWYVPETHAEAAASLLHEAFELHVPAHFHVELASTLWKKVILRGELTAEEAREIRAAVDELPLVTHATAELLDEAFEIALLMHRTVYDCLYVALADRLGCVAVTADEKLHNALRGGPFAARVHWVGDGF